MENKWSLSSEEAEQQVNSEKTMRGKVGQRKGINAKENRATERGRNKESEWTGLGDTT